MPLSCIGSHGRNRLIIQKRQPSPEHRVIAWYQQDLLLHHPVPFPHSSSAAV